MALEEDSVQWVRCTDGEAQAVDRMALGSKFTADRLAPLSSILQTSAEVICTAIGRRGKRDLRLKMCPAVAPNAASSSS